MTPFVQPDSIFKEGAGLIDVYFMKVDASGHSAIVRANPKDKANTIFDLVEDSLHALVQSKKKLYGCAYADFWGWQGDGGLCVFYDAQESKANTTALESAISIVEYGLPSLREDFGKQRIEGNLHLRVAIHKGAFQYKEQRGSIHSRDLNFVAHLEEVAPRDTIVISRDVFDASAAQLKDSFRKLDFSFEGEEVYVYAKHFSPVTLFQWISRIPIEGSFQMNTLSQRPTQVDKAMMIRHATREVVDCGTALNTCSNYLVTREKPGAYRQHVMELLNRGVDYICLVLNPDAEITKIYEKARGEELVRKISLSVDRLRSFAEEVRDLPGKFKVFAYDALPHFACIAIDRRGDGLLLVSPYMPSAPDLKVERGDTMHYLLRRQQDEDLYSQLNAWLDYYMTNQRTTQIV